MYLILNFGAAACRLCRLCTLWIFSAARKHRTVEQNARIHCLGRSAPPVRSNTLLQLARSRLVRSKTLLELGRSRPSRSNSLLGFPKTLLELARSRQLRSNSLLGFHRNRRWRSKMLRGLARSRLCARKRCSSSLGDACCVPKRCPSMLGATFALEISSLLGRAARALEKIRPEAIRNYGLASLLGLARRRP